MDTYSTGYWGIPGRQGGQVHVLKNGKAMCGYKPHPLAQYQWCAHHIHPEYVECKRCHHRGMLVYLRELVATFKQRLTNGRRWEMDWLKKQVASTEAYLSELQAKGE